MTTTNGLTSGYSSKSIWRWVGVGVKKKRPLGPTGANIDRQSATGTQASGFKPGCDGGKLVKGRKRPLVVDTMGGLLVVWVHAANMFAGKAACQVITNLFLLLQTVKIIWAAGGNSGAELCKWVLSQFECQLKIVKKKKGVKGFQVSSHRWVVERTLAWPITSIKSRL